MARVRRSTQQQKDERLVSYGLIALIVIWITGSILLMVVWKPENENDEQHMDPGHLLHEFPHETIPRVPHLGQHHEYLNMYESPLLIFTCARAEYLEKTLSEIYKHIPRQCHIGCPIVISQDGTDARVQNVIHQFQVKFASVDIPLIHLQHPSDDSAVKRLRGNSQQLAYQKLAVHYGWAFTRLFSGEAYFHNSKSFFDDQWPLPQRVLILEEDILVAPDFFDYFAKMAEWLDTDDTLLAVSAFNDNGYTAKVSNATRVLRSDFFPGLGWLLTRRLWQEELQNKWPSGYWDDWLREPAQRKGRHILRPEISRSFHFGTKGGASSNQYGDRLNDVQLNDQPVDWKSLDFGNLEAERYDKDYYHLVVSKAVLVNKNLAQALSKCKTQDIRMEYTSLREFQKLAKSLKLMTDEKAGVPRTAYKGIVETRPHGNHFLFLTPPLEELKKLFAPTTKT